MSQSPAMFQDLSRAFTMILYDILKCVGLGGIVLSMYVNDLGLSVWRGMDIAFEICDWLGALLGMIFKKKKDVKSVQALDYIGFHIDVSDQKIVRVGLMASFQSSILEAIDTLLAEP